MTPVQPELALPSFQTGVARRKQIDGTRHRAELDTFPAGSDRRSDRRRLPAG